MFQRKAAFEKYEISISEIQADESQAQRRAEEASNKDEELKLHKVHVHNYCFSWGTINNIIHIWCEKVQH